MNGPRATWQLMEITVTGNLCDEQGNPLTEKLDCWFRDPVLLIRDLLGNPEFVDDVEFAPYVQHLEELQEELNNATSSEEKERIVEEMASGEWWQRVQVSFESNIATIAPVIVATDKTQLSTFSGDKQAYPIYLTIGNIRKGVRRQPSRRAVALLGYLPVSKLCCFHKKDRALEGYRLFHFAMKHILAPLESAGRDGVEMNCCDGFVRHVYPILAAYMADHPEQCLVCCNKENRCPTCEVDRLERGEMVDSCLRDPTATLDTMRDPSSDDFSRRGLRDVPMPFWADLPHANIFNCIVPDLLHQLHKGVFMTHLVKWVSTGHEDELDERFKRVPPYPGLRHFAKGISTISQWTGNEFRQMEKVFLSLVDGLHNDPRVMVATRAILDFIYLAHYPSHTTSTLEQMKKALETFHCNKQVFIDLRTRDSEHFNIPKVHWMNHYVSSIIDFGSCDGLSTEISERLHIDFTKLAYRATNRKQYVQQMVIWFSRREKVRWFSGFLRWCSLLSFETDPQIASTCHILRETQDKSDDDSGLDEADDDNEVVPAARPGLGFLTPAEIATRLPATHFQTALELFLREEGISDTRIHSLRLSQRRYPIYTRFSRTLPSLRGVEDEVFRDTVFAYPASLSARKPARFSTVLFVENSDIAESIGVQGTYLSLSTMINIDTGPLAGYRVAQVRVLFALPPEVERLCTDESASSHFAYVELFTPFTREPELGSKLYTVARSLQRQQPRVAIIPLGRIFPTVVIRQVHPCHLMPKCGAHINRTWTSTDIVENCDVMYLNSFSDHHMYLFV
ncbi:uncharacterized protein BXZ73DRAFT_56193 [Epithele typhae]|uniref:uncharacterized protein n=1 Tax=Epithele typhae TaxID=378194 RepID=UPI0020085966|nr:uncharacterized protein BXZ73DRAFT_56193 [Epithele typhae]KAH9912506.1 hypothetical protein BXZ73DRAFT_56193 [Epithele typhae]